ncbi:MAG: hypothetical protein KIH01_02645 [Candidatus Freyarchaeota archaeon]|nr:hypothetical protein [Candidatus Jordarchaeia archaeon]
MRKKAKEIVAFAGKAAKFVEHLKSRVKHSINLHRSRRPWTGKIFDVAEKILDSCEVYVFGSVAKGRPLVQAT